MEVEGNTRGNKVGVRRNVRGSKGKEEGEGGKWGKGGVTVGEGDA